MAYNANWVYDETQYLNPVGNRPQIRINGIDLRSFGLELVSPPDLLLPPTRQQNHSISDQSGSVNFRNLYTDWNFSVEFQLSANTPFELHQRKLNFYKWLQLESNNFIRSVTDKETSGLLFELVYSNAYYTRGTVSNSSNSKTVTGVDTKFKSYASQSALFQFQNESTEYYVESVTNDTTLILSSAVSDSHTSESYRLERRKYLVVNYNGTSANSALYNGFHKQNQLGSNHSYTENIAIGFKTNYPYWIGDEFEVSFKNIDSGDSNYSNEEFGGVFLELEGLGNSRFKPNFIFDGEIKKPRIVDSYYSFVSNFDANVKGQTLFNDLPTDPTSIFNNFLYTSSSSKTGEGTIFIGASSTGLTKGVATASSSNFVQSSGPTSNINQIINSNQGVFSCWVNLTSDSLTGEDSYIVDFGSNSLRIFYDVSEQKITGHFGNSGAATVGTSISADQWYNIRAKWKINKTWELWVDTVGSSSSSFTTVGLPDSKIGIGQTSNDNGNSNQLNGLIEDISVWDISPDFFNSSNDAEIRSGTNSKSVNTDSLIFHCPTGSTSDVLGHEFNHTETDYRYNVINSDTYDSNTREYVIDLHETRTNSVNEDLEQNDKVIFYDETGMFAYGEVTNDVDGNTVRVRKDHFTSDQQNSPPATAPRTTYPDLNEIGVHAEFSGSADGDYISANNVVMHKDDYNPYSAISFWAKLDSSKTTDYAQSGDDRTYLFHHFHDLGVQRRGWGFAFDNNWYPVLSYMRRYDSSTKHQVSSMRSITGVIGQHSQSGSHGGWLTAIEISPDADPDYETEDPEDIKVTIVHPEPDSDPTPDPVPNTSVPVAIIEVKNDDDIVFEPHRPIAIAADDEIKIEFANPTTSNVSTRIVVEEVDTYEHIKTPLVSKGMNDDQWHHYSILFVPNEVSNAANKFHDSKNHDDNISFVDFTVYFYIDGVLQVSNGLSITNTALGFTEDSSLIFGRNLDNGYTFPGAIKDFRMWSSRNTNFIGSTSNFSKYVQYLASSCCGSAVDIYNGSAFVSESLWYRFNDSNNSSQITDHRTDGTTRNDASLVNISNYTTSNIRGVKSFISNNLITDGWSDFNNVGGWITSSRFASTENRYDNVHEVSIDTASGSQIKNQKALKLNPLSAQSPSKSLSQIVTLYPSTSNSGTPGTVDYSDTDYVFRCYSKRESTTTSITVQSVNATLFTTHTMLNASSQITTGEYELHELSFALRDSTNSHNAFLINLLFDDSNSGSLNPALFTGMELHKNLIKNGGFQEALSGAYDWDDSSSTYTTATRSTTEAKTSDSSCLKIENTAQPSSSFSADVISPDFSIVNEKFYEISFWAKELSTSSNTNVSLFLEDGTIRHHLLTSGLSYDNLGNQSYQRYSVIWQATATSGNANLIFRNCISSSTILISDVSVLERSKTSFSKINQTSNEVNFVSSIHGLGVDHSSGKSTYYNDVVGNKDAGAFALRIMPNNNSDTTEEDTTSLNEDILVNGNFDLNSLAGWHTTGTVSIDNTKVFEGDYSSKLSSSSGVRQSNLGFSTSNVLTGNVFLDSGSLTLRVGTQDSNGYTISGNPALTKTFNTANQWISIEETISNAGNNIIEFTTSSDGVAYIDNVKGVKFSESEGSSVIFSWLSDSSNTLLNNDYIRLIFDSTSGFSLQSNRNGSFSTICQGDVHFSAGNFVQISGWWDKNGIFDEKDNMKYYSKMMINGEIFCNTTSDISSLLPTYNLKHLFIGGQGYESNIIASKDGYDASFDSIALFSRSLNDEILRSFFVKNEKFRNTNSSLNYKKDRIASDVVSYDFKKQTSEIFSGSALVKASSGDDFEGDFQGLTVENDKAIMYIATSSDNTVTDEVKVSYRPHFR